MPITNPSIAPEQLQAFLLKGLDDPSSREGVIVQQRYPDLLAAKKELETSALKMEALAASDGGVDKVNQRQGKTQFLTIGGVAVATIATGALGYYLSSGALLATGGAALAGGVAGIMGTGALVAAPRLPTNYGEMKKLQNHMDQLKPTISKGLKLAVEDLMQQPQLITAEQSPTTNHFQNQIKSREGTTLAR